MKRFFQAAFFCLCLALLTVPTPSRAQGKPAETSVLDPRETHLANARQLSFGGENAEAYFSFDGKKVIFQSTRENRACDQIFTMNVDGSDIRLVSTGKGRTTCSYFLKSGKEIIYSSTHLGGSDCPPRPDFSRGYVWALYPTFDIFRANANGSKLRRLTTTPGYDAEATVSPDGKTIVFTSDRDGDLELYTMDINGRNVKRLTTTPGYDGGAFFSPDGKQLVYRANHPTDPEKLKDYQSLLKDHLIRPTTLEIFVMNADGTNQRQVTNNGKANFAPYFLPDGKRIIFSSNQDDPKGRNFELYVINADGTGQQRITYNDTFDGFPMFSPDGKKLIFASNRNGQAAGETNVFLVDWKE